MVEIQGETASAFTDMLVPVDMGELNSGEWRPTLLLNKKGESFSPALLSRHSQDYSSFRLIVPSERAREVIPWLRHLSDGYIKFDEKELVGRLPGPVVVHDLGSADEMKQAAEKLKNIEKNSLPLSCKPFYIGLSSRAEPCGEPLPFFNFEEKKEESDKTTPLHHWHVERSAKMASFAGWDMPMWYTSIQDEHKTVRGSAGLFDVFHMGIFEVSGPNAYYFLDIVTTNEINLLRPGESQYSFLLDPDGRIIDDLLVYRIEKDKYLLVLNAANTDKDWHWLNEANDDSVQIDRERPWSKVPFSAELKNLSNWQDAGGSALADIAIQGPRSRDIILTILETSPNSRKLRDLQSKILSLKKMQFLKARIPVDGTDEGETDILIARSGYTGERMGFELFIHPSTAEWLWKKLLEAGEPFGIRPVGLGARDSLRIEAGLPLYGHELAGPLNISPEEAGFAGFVKLSKPFFVGRKSYLEKTNEEKKMTVVRFQLPERGVRMPKTGDAVTESHGRVTGQVTSCAMDTKGFLVGMAYIDKRHTDEGESINIFPRPAREKWDKPYEELEAGDRLVLHNEAKIISR